MSEPNNVTINFFIFGADLDEPMAEHVPDDGVLQLWGKLTRREQQIAMDAAKDLTNRQIGYLRSISHETVKSHMKGILNKLNLNSKNDLRFFALYNGFVDLAERDPDDYQGV